MQFTQVGDAPPRGSDSDVGTCCWMRRVQHGVRNARHKATCGSADTAVGPRLPWGVFLTNPGFAYVLLHLNERNVV